MMKRAWTPERLINIRRMRKARRLYKQVPLFAYAILCEEYSDYGYHEFLDDLRYRTSPKPKRAKNNNHRYARYARMMQALESYNRTREPHFALQVKQLSDYLRKPYRVRVTINKQWMEYGFSPLIPIVNIEKLVNQLNACQTESEADRIAEDFRKTAQLN